MLSRKYVAFALGAALIAASPAINLVVGSTAAAQQQPQSGDQIKTDIKGSLATLMASTAYMNMTPAQKKLARVAAAQKVIAAALLSGTSAADIQVAMSALVADNTIDASDGLQAAAQAAAQIAATAGPGSAAAAQAGSLVSTMTTADPAFASAATSGTGAINAVNAQNQTVTVLTNLATVLAAASTNTGVTIDANGNVTATPGTTFNPCTNVIATYC